MCCWKWDKKCFIRETEGGNWTVQVELDCIITTTGEGGGGSGRQNVGTAEAI